VIGNPPYVKSERLDDLIKKFHQKIFFTARGFYNLYSVFSERSLQLLDGEGIFCFIVQNSFLLGNDYKPTRLFLSQKNISMIVDLGYGVFEDVGVSTLLLFVNGNKRPTLHLKTKWCPLINKQECLYKAPYLTYSKQEFISDFDCLFAIHFKNYKEREILKKIYSIPTKFSDFVLIKRGIEKKTDLRFIEEKKIRVNKNNKNIRKVLLGKESIERYLIKNFKYFFYEPQKRETVYKGEKIFTLPKIIVPENSEKICGVYDEDQFFTTRSLYCCVQKGKQPKVNLRYLLGILNSKILEFYVNKIIKGGEVHNQIRIEDYKHLPIRCSTNKKDPIINLVQKIITLKKLQHKFRELWRYYSRKFRNNYKSLGEILLDDKRAIQEGNFDKVWISEASVYPDEQNELLEKEFKKFRIVGEGDNKLKIYGIEGQREELLLETKANKKEFRDIIYLELLELMDSRVKKKTLKDILSKSEISVIQPNIWEKSGNLLKITKEKFREWLEKENFEIKEDDIVKIDNEIQEIDNLIDAHVFKLYELTKEEVEIVLDSLNVVESIKNDILRKF